MPVVLGYENCQYTPLTTAGTYTIIQQQKPPCAATAFYGVSCVLFGTAPIVNAYDIAGTNTFQLLQGTYTAVGQTIAPSSGNRGIRPRGNVVIVVTGTANTLNALWD